ncbi:MAG: CRISPR-associated protein Cas4 [Candidatus Aegiribacteria sp.]|nr:CRISPR-associated protein Cas4 [Candidatus Aegiribacteria sp.]
MYSETNLLPLSALNHFVYCKRRCALIHIEQQWVENRFTAEGRAQHERVDRQDHKTRDGVRIEYAVPLRSLQLGLIGKADAIEFHPDSERSNPDFLGIVYPVEHKRGRPKPSHCDWVQLCAQALCLEEMMNTEIPEGAIFYGKPRRRQTVAFDTALREETKETALSLHALIKSRKTPPAEYDSKKCGPCSLLEICMPKKHRTVSRYLQECLK